MINPNFDSLLWIILILSSITAITNIILGVSGTEKSKNYGGSDIIGGIVTIVLLGYVVIT